MKTLLILSLSLISFNTFAGVFCADMSDQEAVNEMIQIGSIADSIIISDFIETGKCVITK